MDRRAVETDELAAFDYDLPPSLIAQEPAERRDTARLLLLDRRSGVHRDAHVYDLSRYLRPGDCLVVNDTPGSGGAAPRAHRRQRA